MKKKKIIVGLSIFFAVIAIIALLCTLVFVFYDKIQISDDDALISPNGSRIILAIPKWQEMSKDIPLLELGNIITMTTVSLFVVTIILAVLAKILTRKLDKRHPGKVQAVLEKLVSMVCGLVSGTMGEHNLKFVPYVGTLFVSSILGTLIGMTQIIPSATSDLSVTLAWALVTTGMVWYNNIKNFGFKAWLKGFAEPIVVMTPMNIVSEIAQPISLAFRHFGNVAGGGVLTALIYGALAGLTQAVFSWLPDAVLSWLPPVFQVGIPAVLSIYFDLFSGFVQAFVFVLLTMVYVGGACPPPQEIPEERRAILEKREAKKARKKL